MIHMVTLQIVRFSDKFNIANSLLFWYSNSAVAEVIIFLWVFLGNELT